MLKRLAFFYIICAILVLITVQLSNLSALVATILMALVGFGCAALLIDFDLLRSIRRVTSALERIREGDKQAVLLAHKQHEIDALIYAFNDLYEQDQTDLSNLNAERELLASIFAEMSDGVIGVGSNGRVNVINQTALTMFDLREDEAVGRSLADVVRHHQIIESWQRAAKNNAAESSVVDMGSNNLFLQLNIAPRLNLNDGFTILLQDLTKVRQLETVRRDFISNISHELRTPLAGLRAILETLRDGALNDPDAAERFLQRGEGEVDNLTQMVEELLELSRIESGKVPFQFSAESLIHIVEDTCERISALATRRGVIIQNSLPSDLPPVLADGRRIGQVMTNLVHNAVKFSSEGGSVKISAEPNPKNSAELLINVKDDGIGIPAHDLPRIFERFYKTDRARTSRGTGLGLAIAKHIVQAHGGQIWVASKINAGSTFKFTLPLAEQTSS